MNRRLTVLTLLLTITSVVFGQTINDAMEAAQGELPNKAKNILHGLLAKNPADAEANYRLGNLYYQLGKKDSAKYYFEKGIKPEDKVNYNFAGMGKLALDEKNTVKADEYFNKLTGYGKSKDTKAYTLVGEAYLTSANPDATKAIDQLTKAVTMQIKNAEAQMLLGDAYMKNNQAGKPDAGKAVTSYEYAIQADSTYGLPYMKVGQIYMKSNNIQEAYENFQKGNKLDPEFAPLYRELAEINYYQKKFGEAARLYKIYMDKTGEDIPKKTRYASFLFLNKEYDKTIGIIEGIMKQDSSNVVLSRLIGYSYYEQEKYQEGLNFMKRFFEKADTTVAKGANKVIGSDYAYYGKLLAKNGQDSIAVFYLKKAITLDTLNTDLYLDLANTLYTQKKYQESAAVYAKLLTLKKGTSQDYFQLGKTYYYAAISFSNLAKDEKDAAKKKEQETLTTSNYLKADTAFAKVTEMQPALPTGYFWRGRANAAVDLEAKQGLAVPHFQKFIELATDEVKYKKDLIEAYTALGYYHVMHDENTKATPLWKKVQELDPGNKNAENFFKGMEQLKQEQQQQKPK